MNDSSRNKKCCFSCQAWRNGLVPLSAKGGGTSTSGAAASDVGLISDDATCHDENGPPNNASPCRDRSPRKRGGKRKVPSRGLGEVLCPSTPPEQIRRQARSTMSNFLLFLAITLQDTTCLVGIRDFSSFSLLDYHLLVITTIQFICQFEYTLCSSSVATLEVHQVHKVLRPRREFAPERHDALAGGDGAGAAPALSADSCSSCSSLPIRNSALIFARDCSSLSSLLAFCLRALAMADQNFSDTSWRDVMSYTGALFRASLADCPTCCPGASSSFSLGDDAEAPPGEA